MHPHLLNIGTYGLPSYGVFAALGIIAATAVAWRLAKRDNVDADFVLDAIFWTVIAGFVGARLGYVFISWVEEGHLAAETLVSTGGGVYLAGLVSGLAALLFLCHRRRLSFPVVGDIFAPALALGHAFGRVGCHLAGCCWGCRTPAGTPWFGVRYPRISSDSGLLEGSWPYLDHLERGWVTPGDAASQPVVPVQLLEASFDVLLFLGLLLLWKYRQFRGQVTLVYIGAYAVGRFGLEYLRGDAERGLYGPFSFSQWICLTALTAIVVVLTQTARSVKGESCPQS